MPWDELPGEAVELTDRHREFAERFGIEPERLSEELTVPHYLNVRYSFHSVSDILQLEFTKLLEADVRFRKCGRCGSSGRRSSSAGDTRR